MLITDEYTVDCLKSYLPAELHAQMVVPYELSQDWIVSFAEQATDENAEAIANCLKIGVEHVSDGNPELAFELADTIIRIGKVRENGSLVGLGTMAQGDTLAHTGMNIEAWDKLQAAGDIYLEAADKIGWARTRVGRLHISPEMNSEYVEEAFDDASKAESIFKNARRYDRLLRLYHSWAIAHTLIGQYEEAIAYYERAIETAKAQTSDAPTDIIIAHLYIDVGNAYNNLGELQLAMDYLTRARRVLLDAEHHFIAGLAAIGMANNHAARGQYRQALHLMLNHVLPDVSGYRAEAAKISIIDYYLALNRNIEAYELAQAMVTVSQHDANRNHFTALSALLLATAQTRLGYLGAAQQSLDLTEKNFKTYPNMVTLIELRRGQIALRAGDFTKAWESAHATAEQFRTHQQAAHWIDALLLGAEAALQANDLSNAQALSYQALRAARDYDLLPASYRCYTVLGQILEKRGKNNSCICMYRAALQTLRHIHSSLTISLRAGFLEDKLLPFRRLMHIYLTQGKLEAAFHTLEQIKSQVFLDYLTQRETLLWVENEQTRPLMEALNKLRDKYRWLMRLQSAPPADEAEANTWYRDVGSYNNLQQIIIDCEKQIRRLTEQLDLFSNMDAPGNLPVPETQHIQARLDSDTLLIAFYVDSEAGWCMAVSSESIVAQPLGGTIAELRQLVEDKWRSNLDFALEVGAADPLAPVLSIKAQQIGAKLYQILLQPLAEQLKAKKRLIVVPYGLLHQVPFNILRDNNGYLIESHEIVVLPSASLLLREAIQRKRGAVVVAHSWDGRLAHSVAEGQMVHDMLGGIFRYEQDAKHDLLQSEPCKVLHISTHGVHRIDQPDFAYLELGDGPIYSDEILQGDLSYELVVLSACEVGRAHVTAGDELIGLGRSFLYAGAGALITSLWRVNEQHTFQLMESLYRALCQGQSKAAALRQAQRNLLSQYANLHPAFWAAFQLISNAEPLSNGGKIEK